MIKKKRAQLSPNPTAAILQANKRFHSLAVTMYYARYNQCNQKLIEVHGTTAHPIQYFRSVQEAAIVDALANHSATKFTHSEHRS
jgi:hypothetical protein